MKNKSIWAGLASLLFLMGAEAAPVSLETAKKTAEKFYGVQLQKAAVKSLPALSCVYPKNTKGSDFVPYYIFNAEKEQGFVIVAGDDNATSLILGYSDKGSFQTENMPDNLKFWLGFYEEGVRNAAARGGSGNMQAKSGFTKAEVVKAPLLDSIQYNQDAPYNDLCPIDPSTGLRSMTGCVATALASIARYYEYPKHGQDSISYTSNGLRLSMNFAKNTYDWENMLKDYNGRLSQYTEVQRNAVAMLMRDMGYAVQMSYGSNASGAHRDPTTFGIVQYMGFDSILNYRERMDYDDDDEWIAVLKDNLDNDLPVYYTGQGDGGGHAFICDGYNEDDFFHINWGWGNSRSNGYFSVRNLDPENISGIGAGTGGGYTSMQGILHNMVPPGHKHCQDLFLLRTNSAIEANQVEDSIYSFEKTPLVISFQGIRNRAMSLFKGSLALAAFQDGELVRIVSEEQPIEIIKQKSNSGTFTFTVVKDSLTNGDYELWVVCKPETEDALWQKVYAFKNKRYTNDSYVPVRIEEDSYQLLKANAILIVQLECAETRNINMYIYINKEPVGSGQVSASVTSQFSFRHGLYELRFWTRGYDTSYVYLNLTQDTTINVIMQERLLPPYLRGVRVKGNNATVMWYKEAPQGEKAYPTGFAVYLDSVEVAQVGSTVTEYTLENIPEGAYWAGLRAVYKTGESEMVNRRFFITNHLANETSWNGRCLISPNPSDGYFTLEVDRDCRLQVASMAGKVLFERTLTAGSHQVDMRAYTAGAYLFHLVGKNGETTLLKAILK